MFSIEDALDRVDQGCLPVVIPGECDGFPAIRIITIELRAKDRDWLFAGDERTRNERFVELCVYAHIVAELQE